jgi:hypothetical protein
LKIVIWGIRRSGNSPVREWIANVTSLRQVINCNPTKTEDDAVNSIEELPPLFPKKIKADYKIVILRDPYNLFASRIKHYDLLSSEKTWVDENGATKLWRMYAKVFLEKPKGIILVNYNEFIKSVEYRKNLAKKLKCEFKDDTIQRVSDNGLGSSFDCLDYDGKAQKMPVFDRWTQYKDIEAFRGLFTPEIVQLSKQIFGMGVDFDG